MFFEKKDYFSPCVGLLLLSVLLVGLPHMVFAAATSSAETRFVESYAAALRAIDAGRLDTSSSQEVHSINSALQKDLLSFDSKVKQLKSDSVTASGADRDEILDQLVGLGAERERMFADYQQQLEQLVAKQGNVAEMSSASVVQAPAREVATVQSTEETTPESPRHILIIESVPEDVGEGLFE